MHVSNPFSRCIISFGGVRFINVLGDSIQKKFNSGFYIHAEFALHKP